MIYTTGTIAINGNTVTGTGTNFSAPLSLIRVGCTLIAIGNPVQIFTITEIKSGTELSVTPAANPAIPAGTKFSILLSDSISVDGLAQDVAETLRYYQGRETEIAAAVEWWKDFGGDGQMDQLLANIRAETAQSTANAQKTEADKKTTEGYKNAAATSATAAKSSQDAAKASETASSNSKTAAATSETNAAKSAADALNYRNQAQGIVGTDIGLGENRRDWPDCNDPTGYIGFCRAEESKAKNFPSIASGELYLVGWLARGDGATINGCFIGTVTRSLYTYSYKNADKSVAWTRHARKDEVDRLLQVSNTAKETQLWDGEKKNYIFVNNTGWGAYSKGGAIKLGVMYGGTGAGSADEARKNLMVMHDAKTSLSSTQNLDDLKGNAAGFYHQYLSANAKPELNYPRQVGGSLLVQKTGAGDAEGCIQTYYVFNDAKTSYRRVFSGEGWSKWKKIVVTERIDEWGSETWVYNSDYSMRLGLTASSWGCYSDTQKEWIPLDVSHGGTGAATIDGARTHLGLGRDNSPQLNSLFLDRYSDSTGAYTTGGMLHTRLLANDNTVRLAADMYVQTFPNEQGRLTIRFTYGGSTGATKYLDFTSEGNLIVDSAILKSTVEKPLQINSANPAIRFNETDRPANTPTYTLIGNGGDWFIQKRNYDDAGSVSNAIAYSFANDRLDVQNLKASGLIAANSGIATLTGHDWNAQHTDNVDKFRPIAGSTNGPAGSMVLGGFHAQYSTNYAVQFGGRNSSFWGRTIEKGTVQEWKKLLTVDDLNSSTDLNVKSVTTSSPVKSGGGRVDVLGSIADFSAMSCYVRGLNSTGSSAAWVLGMHSGEGKMVSLKNYHSNAEILLNGSDGAVQLKTGTVNGATAQALTINKDELNSTVDLTLTKQSGTGNRFVLQNLGNTELSFAAKVWGSSDRQNVFEVGTSAGYLFYAQKTSAGQLFDVNGAINCTTLNQSSDRDLKDDILVISDATKAIRKMNGYTYTLKENGMPYAGVIAQEVMEAIPEAVGSFTRYGEELQGPTIDGNELREETRYLNVDYAAVTGLLVQVARETDNRVTELEEENASLRANIAVMDERITKLEALVSKLTGSEK
ncbi:tail fiber domain-containing protein [Escherichia coli]